MNSKIESSFIFKSLVMPKDLSFLCNADLSIPINSAVREILPPYFLTWETKYSRSNISLASLRGNVNISFDLFRVDILGVSIAKSAGTYLL